MENGTFSRLQIRYTFLSKNADELYGALSPECKGRRSSYGEKCVQGGFLEKGGLARTLSE